MVKEKNIPLCVVLSFLTCGIYGIYWMLELTRDVDTVSQNPTPRNGGMVILLSLVTCGIYTYFWMYKNGELLEQTNNRTRIASASNPILFLVLTLVGFGIVNYVIMQADLNKYALASNRPQYPQYPQPPMPPMPPQPPVGPTM